VVVALLVAWRSVLVEGPVRESLAKPMSQYLDGELTIGLAMGSSAVERYGKLVTREWERKVVVVNAEGSVAGEVLKVRGKFFVPEKERNPGLYQELDAWKRAGVFGGFVIQEESKLDLKWQWAPLRWAELLRDRMRVGITSGVVEDSPGRAVIQAMVLGEKPPRDSEVSRAFRESGAMHVFAVSGLHVTLVGSLFWVLFANLPVPRRVSVIVVMMAMISYAMVTGMRPPAIRATVMEICFLSAFLLRRRPSLFNALALSAILVIFWRPSQIQEVGFQLSYGVLVAIGLGVGLALKFTGKIAELDPFFPSRLLTDGQRKVMKVRKFFADLGASSLAAWLGSLPFMIWHFGIVTPIAVVASLLLIPATWAILALAFLSMLLGVIHHSLGAGVNRVNSALGTGAFYAAKTFAKVPMGHWRSSHLVPADWVAFDCENGGAASFLNLEGGVMIDVGGREFYDEQLKGVLGRWNVDVGTVFLTHPDGDHVGGLPSLLDRGGLESVILPVERALSPGYREFLEKAEGGGCEVLIGKKGEGYELGDEFRVEILRTASEYQQDLADHRIMVMKVFWKGWKVLVTGDLGINEELEMLADETDLSADVVLMGQHEWGVSGQYQFLEATGAKVVITSAGPLPEFEKPKERWVELLRSHDYHLFNQWESGAVMLDFAEDELRVWSFLQPDEEVVLQR